MTRRNTNHRTRLQARVERRRRHLQMESLEPRRLLVADWQNPLFAPDVTDDGKVDVTDAIGIIRDLRRHGSRDLTTPFNNSDPAALYVDADGNERAEVSDAVTVIRWLRRFGSSSVRPQLALQLQADTGISATDKITNDARLAGSITTASGTDAGTVKLRVNRGPVQMLPLGTGAFSLTAAQLGSLADGDNRVSIAVTDTNNNPNLIQLRFVLDTLAPAGSSLRVLAADDSGIKNDDNVTKLTQPRLTLEAEAGVSLRLEVDGSPIFEGVATGVFTQATPTLSHGTHSVQAIQSDPAGNTTTTGISLVVDTVAPSAPTLDLAATSDTGARGDLTTSNSRVTLAGVTEANSFVTFTGLGATVRSAGDGTFRVPNIQLAMGANPFSLAVSDLAGNTNSNAHVIQRSGVQTGQDPVLRWNQAILNAIVLDATPPPVATRGMALMSIAMLDVVNAFEGTASYLVSLSAPAGASVEAALSSAAYEVMRYLYPGQLAAIDGVQAAALDDIDDGQSKMDGVTFGALVGQAVVALREQDGWDTFIDYVPGSGAGAWQQTPPMYDVALGPHWGQLTPFAVADVSALTPAGPPDLSSQAWADAYNEVKTLGSATGSSRTPDQTQIARFWADGAGTYTPPGHWNAIAAEFAVSDGLSVGENARMFAMLNAAMGDAAIVSWNAKFTTNFWRPITAIQQGEADGNAATLADPAWTPLLITPPFPEYTSGHSTFSGAAAQILTDYFGERSFTTASLGLPGITRSFNNFHEAANEASRSRIFGGIHYSFSGLDGLASGRAIADEVLARFSVADDTQAPRIAFLSPASGSATSVNPQIQGWALDNLAGVASATVQVDDGAIIPLTLDANGRFTFTPALADDGSADGEHVLHFRALDKAGLASGSFDFRFTLDTIAPSISLTAPLPGATLDGTGRLQGTVSGTGSNLVSLTYQIDATPAVPLFMSGGGGSIDQALDLSRLAVGAHTLIVTARDAAGLESTSTVNFTLGQAAPLTVASHTPLNGASDIGSNLRPQIFFSRPINAATLNSTNLFATDTTGAPLPATIVPAQDGSSAWLFFANPMPGGSTISLHVNGETILGPDAVKLDADGDGVAGGELVYRFTTVSLAPLAGTSLSGRVVDPGDDLKPMTFDDFRGGPDGIPFTADDVFRSPIANAKVFLLGLEDQAVYTDANGFFAFASVPAGVIKLAIDGRTATNAPTGVFWPEMVMDLELEVGRANTVMGTMGTREEREAHLDRTEVYLPRLQTSILKPLNPTEPTIIQADAISAPNLTPQQRQYLKLEVQPGSALGHDGLPVANAQVGLSTVPTQMVTDMLPPGLMQLSATLTIQAPGVERFSPPITLTFPNIYNADPGSKIPFYSFDHATGRFVIEGTATVSIDGKSVTTDPGTGISKPGWHGPTPPGSDADGDGDNDEDDFDPCESGSHERLLHGDYSEDVDEALINSGRDLQRIQDGYGDYLYDSYEATVVMPAGLTPEQLLANMVRDLNGTLNNPVFDAVNEFDTNPNPKVGDIYHIDILGPDDGEVMLTRLAPDHFQFDTLSDPSDLVFGGHPEFGSREFGFERNGDGTVTFYTRGASRPRGWKEGLVGGPLQTLGWQALTDGVINAVMDQGGWAVDYNDSRHRQSDPPDCFDASGEGEGEAIPPFAEVQVAAPKIFHYRIELVSFANGSFSQSEISGRTNDEGHFEAFLPANTAYVVSLYNPVTHRHGQTIGRSPQSGVAVEFGSIHVGILGVIDQDLDGLDDFGEFVIGTSPTTLDTDNDGISDLAEIQQGLDPLGGRPFATGVVASLPLQGEANELVVVGSTLRGEEQTAYLATGSYGLAIVNASRFQQPLLLGELDLPGDSVDVAIDARLQIAAVASSEGLHLVNIASSAAPVLLQTIHGSFSSVEIVDGIAYVGVGGGLRAYDLATGERTEALGLSGSTVTAIAREGNFLYTRDENGLLRIVELTDTGLLARGSLQTFAGGGKLFVGGGIAYVPQGTGYATADVTNPASPSLLANSTTNNLAASAIAANGSGLAIGVGSVPLLGNFVHVLDDSDHEVTNGFLTQYALSSVPYSIALGAGIAFVASGSDGLQVVNYRSFDNLGVAPVVSATVDVVDADPGTPGTQVQEGTLIQFVASISDDVQVRNVELLVNGQVVANDVSFPFELSAALPTIAANAGDQLTIQVRATDTGGNASVSTPLAVQLVPDTFAPSIVRTNVPEGSKHGSAFRAVTFSFTEAIDPATVNAATFLLQGPGGTIAPSGIQFRNQGRSVQLTYPAIPLGINTLTIHAADVKDVAGNALSASDITYNFQVTTHTIAWSNPGGGDWNDPLNWENGVLPGPTDDVLIDIPGDVTITISDDVEIRSLLSHESLALTSGTLTAAQSIKVNGQFTLAGGTLQETRVLQGADGSSFTASGSNWSSLDGVLLEVDLLVEPGSNLSVSNGLALQGVITLDHPDDVYGHSALYFEGTNTVSGTGSIVLGQNNWGYYGYLHGDELIIGSNVTVEGAGQISVQTLINRGTVLASQPSQELRITSATTTNLGVLDVRSGSELTVHNLSGDLNEVTLNGASQFTINSGEYRLNRGLAVGANQAVLLHGTYEIPAGAILSGNAATVDLAGDWRNAGVIQSTGSTVNLGGSFTLADLGTFQRTGGTVNLTGTLDNRGALDVALLKGESSPVKAFVPTSDALGATWLDPAFDDSGWLSGSGIVGYDRRAGAPYGSLIGLDIESAMAEVNNTAYVRMPFTVADPSLYGGLTLNLRYADGFVAYLNGVQVASANDYWGHAWDSTSYYQHETSEVETFDLSDYTYLLRPGTNVLAIHLLDDYYTDDTTLLGAELRAGLRSDDTNLALTSTTGSWNLAGGTVQGGTISATGGVEFLLPANMTGRLEGVTLGANLTVPEGATLYLKNGLTLSGTTLALQPTDDQWWDSYVTLDNPLLVDGTGTVTLGRNNNGYEGHISGSALTIGSQVTVRGSGSLSSGVKLTNLGTLQADGPTPLHVIAGFIRNEGNFVVLNAAQLNLNGDYTQAASGALSVEIRGTGDGEYGEVYVQSIATLAGTLNITRGGGFNSNLGDTFKILTFSTRIGEFATISGNGESYSTDYNAEDLTIERIAALLPQGAAPAPGSVSSLSNNELAQIVEAAINLWISSGLADEQTDRLRQTAFVIEDLATGSQLASSRPGLVRIDDDAAGFGWFIDKTPHDDVEFESGGAAEGKMDLLTVVLHELGHILGLDHTEDPNDLMFSSLGREQRKRASHQHLDQLFSLWGGD